MIRRWTWYLYVGLALNTACWIGTTIVFAIICVPIDKQWNPSVRGWCMTYGDLDKAQKAFYSLNCVIDFMYAILPFFILRRAQMSLRRKLAICLLLAGGLLTAACSIGAITSLDFASSDKTYDLVPLTYWIGAEVYGLIIIASLPAMHQLNNHYHEHQTFNRIVGDSSQTSSKLATLKSKFTKRNTSDTTSVEMFNHPPAITKTTDVTVELQDQRHVRNMWSEDRSRALGLEHPRTEEA
ncbi:MAG: hypothetical protein Q9162_004142, partial [Coniocarpon cinnabarinum]